MKVICKHCGTENPIGTRYCIKCGQNISNETSDTKAAVIALSIIFAVLTLIAIVYLFITGNPIFLAICGCCFLIKMIYNLFKR